jgi:hypothetical protein
VVDDLDEINRLIQEVSALPAARGEVAPGKNGSQGRVIPRNYPGWNWYREE